jgi:zinc protease
VINEELVKIRDGGVTEDELVKAKEAYLQAAKVGRAEDGSIASQLLASMFNQRTLEYTAEYENRVSKLTIEEVNAALKTYILPDQLVTAVGGDFEKKD